MHTASIWVALQDAPLDVGAAFAFLQAPGAGGITIFVGTTRQWTDGKETRILEYEAYRPMASKEMEQLSMDALKRWRLERVCVLHRLGSVPIGEASVIVGVAAAHRAEAFAAARYLIDTLKQHVPIWKAEHFADGTAEWVGTTSGTGTLLRPGASSTSGAQECP